MPDHGRRYANGKLKKVDRELQAIYRQAEKELKGKLADFVDRSKQQDKLKQKQKDAGLITEEEYQSWLKGQVFQKKRWEAKVKQVQQVMYNHNVEAAKIVHENKMDVFAENYNYQAFMTEGITGVSFDIYDTDAVAMLIKDRPDLLPEWNIDEPKDYTWNYRKVNNAITQGIIQGESVEKVMKRLADSLCTQNENKMRMFARTAINEAESAGRQKQMEDSAKKGIRIEKEWLATLDNRTRDTHRHLDGQRKPYNEPFKSDLGDIMFPCDPTADPANVYNCRCTTIPVYPDYEDEQDNWRENETIDGMTYQEWKEEKKHKQSTSDDFVLDFSEFDKMEEEKKQKRHERYEKRKAIANQKSTYSFADDKVMEGYSKLERPENCKQTAENTNPHFNDDVQHKKNCACCVVANEARARGYDVIAGTRQKNMRNFSWDMKGNLIHGKGYWTDCFEGIKMDSIETRRKNLVSEKIGDLMRNYGNGSRAVVFVEWERDGGHYFTVQNVDDNIIFTNPQNEKDTASTFFNDCKPSKTKLFRIDNCRFTDYVRQAVVSE